MSHPAYTGQTILTSPVYWVRNGVLVGSSENMLKYGYTSYPASTNNRRVGLFRPPSNWSKDVVRWSVSEGAWSYYKVSDPTQTESIKGQTLNIADATLYGIPPLSETLEYDLSREALAALTSSDVSFNASLLQLKSTARMVGNLSTGIAHGTNTLLSREFPKGPKQLRRFLVNGSRKAIRQFSGKYLEFLYGWKPLADDIGVALERMDLDYQKNVNVFKFTLKKKRTLKGTYTLHSSIGDPWDPNPDWQQVIKVKQTSRISYVFEFPEYYQQNIPTTSLFGTLWEVAPWSFVIDWITPIGDWIGALESMQWSPFFKGGTRSTHQLSESSSEFRPTQNPTGYNGWYTSELIIPRVDGFTFRFRRQVVQPWELIDVIRFPALRGPLSLNHATQGIALLTQVMQKWFSGTRLDIRF